MQREKKYNNEISPTNLTCFALMGLDYLVSRDGNIKLCEVNTHPALEWGSMLSVDTHIYNRLIKETLQILLLNKALKETGFNTLI